ncbi:MAG: methyltransferase protein, partial [Solirubrobacterales bacterium]|nr:methyltransferase protein [Solirubrobacterales bacterium]
MPPEVAIESLLPATLPPDRPSAAFLQGRAVGVRRLDLLVDGVAQAPLADRMPRSDLGSRSGWWAVVTLPGRAAGKAIEIAARADGATVALGRIPIEAPAPAAPAGASIAVCMATFEPDPVLFRRQVESLRAQTDTDWVCVISDDGSSPAAVAAMQDVLGADDRFRFSRAPERQVFYRNFERALTLAPPDATLVALSDQDDVWYPEKLATLRAALGDAPLVYSDQRLVGEDGAVVRESLWAGRRPNHTDMTSLLVAGGVTGAAMLMRRDVADAAIGFPDTPGMDFHDHWLALVALAHGDIAYVDRPLYDYVQHREAVFGRRDEPIPEAMRHLRTRWRAAYFGGYVQRLVFAEALLARCGAAMSEPRRRALRRYVRAHRS